MSKRVTDTLHIKYFMQEHAGFTDDVVLGHVFSLPKELATIHSADVSWNNDLTFFLHY